MTGTAAALIDRAYQLRRAGDRAAALADYRAAAAQSSDPAERAHCLRHIGDLARELGQLDAARAASAEAETLYRTVVDDPLALANTVRLRALIDNDAALWREARALYAGVAARTTLDLDTALAECDRRTGAAPDR